MSSTRTRRRRTAGPGFELDVGFLAVFFAGSDGDELGANNSPGKGSLLTSSFHSLPSISGRTVQPQPRGSFDAGQRPSRDSSAASLADEAHGHSAGSRSKPSGSRLHCGRTQHQVGDRHHLHPNCRRVALSVGGGGPLLRAGGELVDECPPGSPIGTAGCLDGAVATPHFQGVTTTN